MLHRSPSPELIEHTVKELVTQSRRFGNARLFSRWFDALRQGKHVVVVVVSDEIPKGRHWLITAYIARKLAQGDVEWTRS